MVLPFERRIRLNLNHASYRRRSGLADVFAGLSWIRQFATSAHLEDFLRFDHSQWLYRDSRNTIVIQDSGCSDFIPALEQIVLAIGPSHRGAEFQTKAINRELEFCTPGVSGACNKFVALPGAISYTGNWMLDSHPRYMIDALKSLEKESAEYDCRLQTVLDSLPLIAWTVAANGIPLYYNSKWFQYTGLSKSEPVDLIQVIHPDDFQSAMEKRMAAYASGEVYEAEFRLRRYDGVYRWHRTLSEPVRDSAGRVIRYLKTTTDIDAERELERLNAELDRRVLDRTTDLAQANAELEAFTYHVAHDLRAPLRAIASKCRILEEDFREFLPEDAVGLIDRQVQAANKLGTLIDELLKLSRLTREQAIHQVVDLSTLACDVAAELAHENDDAIVVVQESMSTVADPRLIRLLLGNLISNALQYSPKGGQIHVGCEPTENGLAFFVRDQGTGFDMQFADQIFRPFERLVSDTEFPGTGVGLANVARIVSKHQGKVWAVSELGKGSTFYFTLG